MLLSIIRLNDTSLRPKTFVAINVSRVCEICSKLSLETSFTLYFEQILLVIVVVSLAPWFTQPFILGGR